MMLSPLLALALLAGEPLSSGERVRTVEVDGLKRSYLVHVPPQYDPKKPTPVVLALHGAGMNASLMATISGLSSTADQAGFIVVYPNGTGSTQYFLVWNSGLFHGRRTGQWPDDVKFIDRLLDDLESAANVDTRRVYATGLSNGGMMSYRLAAELSQRIAAVAPVAGTMATDEPCPGRPVSVLHIHGTADPLVPFAGPGEGMQKFVKFKSVRESIRIWTQINGCPQTPQATDLPDTDKKDGTRVKREFYGPGKDGAVVVLYVIEGGGHTWPGWLLPTLLLGKTTRDISANDLIWEFFERHPITRPAERPAAGGTGGAVLPVRS